MSKAHYLYMHGHAVLCDHQLLMNMYVNIHSTAHACSQKTWYQPKGLLGEPTNTCMTSHKHGMPSYQHMKTIAHRHHEAKLANATLHVSCHPAIMNQ